MAVVGIQALAVSSSASSDSFLLHPADCTLLATVTFSGTGLRSQQASSWVWLQDGHSLY